MAVVEVSPFQECITPDSHNHTHAKVNAKNTSRKRNETVTKNKNPLFPSTLPFSLQPRHNPRNTIFREFYDLGEIPIAVAHGGGSNAVTGELIQQNWIITDTFLLFFDGIREIDHPYRLLSVQGAKQLLAICPEKVANVLPQLILPL